MSILVIFINSNNSVLNIYCHSFLTTCFIDRRGISQLLLWWRDPSTCYL